MSKTTLKLMKDDWNEDYLQIVYEDEDKLDEDIYFMDQNQLAAHLAESIDFTNDLYGGDDNGDELCLGTNVCTNRS